MLFPSASFLLVTAASSALAKSIGALQQQPREHLFDNGPIDRDSHFPTVRESVVMARRILHLTTIGTLVTTFPPSHQSDIDSSENLRSEPVSPAENRPAVIAGSPIGLMEYYADCGSEIGNPTLLAIDIATPYKNYAEGSNISLSVRWWPTRSNSYASSWSSYFSREDPDIPTPHTPAALPRFSLHGRLEPITDLSLRDQHNIAKCFLRAHPDSHLWQPGNDIHFSRYVTLVVEHVYWFGGFGDRARIGWLPIDVWKNITMDEVVKMRLPGEDARSSAWRDWL